MCFSALLFLAAIGTDISQFQASESLQQAESPPPASDAKPGGEEVIDKRTVNSKTFKTDKEGTFRSEVYGAPIHFRDESGKFQDVDVRFVRQGGRFRNAANSFKIEMASDAKDPVLGEISLGPDLSLGYGLQGARPGPAIVNEYQISYPGILPAVDLEVFSGYTGLKEDLVLRSKDAPTRFVFPLQLDGLTAHLEETGGISYVDSDGEVRMRTPQGWMEDSAINPHSGEGARSYGVKFSLIDVGGQSAIEVVLDESWLNDPSRLFPVRVDPSTTIESLADDTFVHQPWDNDNSADWELKAGAQYDIPDRKARSFLHFDLGSFSGQTINSAWFNIWSLHSPSCSPREIRVYRVTQDWAGSTTRTWPGPNVGDIIASGNFAKGYSGSCPEDWVHFDVTNAVRYWTSGVWNNQGLALIAADEGDKFGWKKFRPVNYPGPHPHMVIDWTQPNRAPYAPEHLSPASGTIGTTTPSSLSARFSDPDGNNGYITFRVRNSGGTIVFQGDSPLICSGCSYAKSIPSLSEGVYTWDTYGSDGALVGPSSSPWTFTVDPTAPAAPSVSSSTHPNSSTWYASRSPSFSWSASDTSGINGYSYTFDQSSTTTPDTTSEGTGTSTSYSNVADGVWYFHVRARNGANLWGNPSHFKIQVDGSASTNLSVSSSTHPSSTTWYANNTPSFSWSASDLSGISGYSYWMDQSATTTPDDTSEGTGTSYTSPARADGIWYFHIKAKNGSGLWSTTVHREVRIDVGSPPAPTVSSTSHPDPNSCYPTTGFSASWNQPSDISGIAGYAVLVDSLNNTNPTTPFQTARTYSETKLTGSWYLHVRAQDMAGNWGTTAHFPFSVDIVSPSSPLVTSSTHPITEPPTWYSNNTPAFSWSATDIGCGIGKYRYTLDQSPSGSADGPGYEESSATTKTYSAQADGVWYFHIKAQDRAGNWSTQSDYEIRIDTTTPAAPAIESSTHPTQNDWYRHDDPSFKWSATDVSGIAGYRWELNQVSNTEVTALDPPDPATSTAYADQASGNWWFHVRAKDGSGKWGPTGHYGIKIDMVSPTTPVISNASHLPLLGSSNRSVNFDWLAAADAHSGVAGYSFAFTNSATATADDTIDTTGLSASASLDDGVWWFHLKAIDAVGNPSAAITYGPFKIDANSCDTTPSSLLSTDFAGQSDENGLEQFFPMRSQDLGTGTGFVHLRTGNLVAQYTDAQIPGQGLNTYVRHTYNHNRHSINNGAGLGWSLSITDLDGDLDDIEGLVSDVDLNSELVCGDIIDTVGQVTGSLLEFTDGDGTTHRFIRKGGPGSRWESPPGVSLKIREVLDQFGLATAYELIRPDGVIYRTERITVGILPSWRVVSVTDRNGNQLTYEYAAFGTPAKTRVVAVKHNRTGASPVVKFQYSSVGNLTKIITLEGVSAVDPATGSTRSYERHTDFTVDASSQLLTSVLENSHLASGHIGRRTTSFGYQATTNRLQSVTDAKGNATSFGYDGSDRVSSITDRRGKSSSLGYAAGTGEQTTTFTNPLGKATTYVISDRAPISDTDRRVVGGNIKRISDAGNDLGPVVTNFAWTQNRLTSSTDGAGATTSMEYNDLGLVTKVTRPSPNVNRSGLPPEATTSEVVSTLTYNFPPAFRYDASKCADPAPSPGPVTNAGECYAVAEMTQSRMADNVSSQRRITDFSYGITGNLNSLTQRSRSDGAADAADRTTAFTYYNFGGLKQIDGPRTDVSDVTTFGTASDADYGDYDRTGMPKTLTDAKGKTKSFIYSPYGMVAQVTDREGRVTKNLYDERNNLVETTDPEGNTAGFAYDLNDNRTKEATPRGMATGTADDFTTIYSFDPNGWVTQVSRPTENATSPKSITSISYLDDGTKATETSPIGSVTTFEYYNNGAIKKVTAPATTGVSAVTEYFYDSAGRVKLVRHPISNDAGSRPETETAYTPQGAAAEIKETSSSGAKDRITQLAYNAHGQGIQGIGPRSVGGTTQEKLDAFDSFGQLTVSKRRLSSVKTIDSTYGYDQAGNQVSVSQQTGASQTLTWNYAYDQLNQLIAQTTDPENPGHTVSYTYSDEGVQTERRDLVSGSPVRSTAFSYNPNYTVSSQVSTNHATGETLSSCNYPAGGPVTSGYDADGNLLTRRTIQGNTGCSGGTTLKTESYSYDHRGMILSMTQAIRSPATGSDISRIQSFSYNLDATRASVTHDGKTTNYSYSPAGWMTAATSWNSKSLNRSYLASGAPSSDTPSGGAAGSYSYHPDGSLSALSWVRSSVNLRSHTSIAYDVGGLRTGESVSQRNPDGTTLTGNGSFSYDLLERLASWTSPFPLVPGETQMPTTTYSLDDAGNVTREQIVVGSITRSDSVSTFSANRLTEKKTTTADSLGLPGPVTDEAFTYSGLGEETGRRTTVVLDPLVETDETATSHHPSGHIKRIDDSDPVATDVDYLYDLGDRVIARTEGSATTLYFYLGGGSTLAEEADGSGGTKTRYFLDSQEDTIAQEDSSSAWTWLLDDPHGNVATLLSDSGAVIEQRAYSPYGKKDEGGSARTTTSGAPTSTLGFQKAPTDPKTGNLYLGPRQYDPTTARFTTPDVYVASGMDLQLGTDPLTGNRYLFAAANPVSYYDDGHGPKPGKHNRRPYGRIGCKNILQLPNPTIRQYMTGEACAPPWFPYDPIVVYTSDGVRMADPKGSCSALTLGNKGKDYNFLTACRVHDYGYDLLRHLRVRGARRAVVDTIFLEEMTNHCLRRKSSQRLHCLNSARIYYAGVVSNSVLQRRAFPTGAIQK